MPTESRKRTLSWKLESCLSEGDLEREGLGGLVVSGRGRVSLKRLLVVQRRARGGSIRRAWVMEEEGAEVQHGEVCCRREKMWELGMRARRSASSIAKKVGILPSSSSPSAGREKKKGSMGFTGILRDKVSWPEHRCISKQLGVVNACYIYKFFIFVLQRSARGLMDKASDF